MLPLSDALRGLYSHQMGASGVSASARGLSPRPERARTFTATLEHDSRNWFSTWPTRRAPEPPPIPGVRPSSGAPRATPCARRVTSWRYSSPVVQRVKRRSPVEAGSSDHTPTRKKHGVLRLVRISREPGFCDNHGSRRFAAGRRLCADATPCSPRPVAAQLNQST